MSPEQAMGERAIDARSDIYALGAVTYEMLTGEPPFSGATVQAIVAKVLTEKPMAPSAVRDTVTPNVEAAVLKALSKLPADRWSTTKLFAEALTRTDVADGASRGSAPNAQGSAGSRRRGVMLGLALGAVGAVALSVATAWFAKRAYAPEPAWSAFTQLTDASGVETSPSISPDGESFVYVSRARGTADIYSQRVGGRNPTLVVGDSTVDELWPAYSPDGKQIAYNVAGGGIFIVGATGESPRRLTSVGVQPSWSPDGTQIVYGLREGGSAYYTNGGSVLEIVSVSGGTPRRLDAKLPAGGTSKLQPSWSPSGTRIAFWAVVNGVRDIYTVAAGDGTAVALTLDAAADFAPSWAPDGKFIYFASDRGGSMGVWRMAIDEASGTPQGSAEWVATGTDVSMDLPHLSADGRTVIFRSTTQSVNPAALPFNPATRRVGLPTLLQQRTGVLTPTDVSPDGQWLLLVNTPDRHQDVFLMRSKGRDLSRLTDDDARDWEARFIGGGDSVSFRSNASGTYDAWSIRRDGSNRTRLTNIPEGVFGARFSPDGMRLATSLFPTEAQDQGVVLGGPPWPMTRATSKAAPGVTVGAKTFSAYNWSRNGRWLSGQLGNQSGEGAGHALYDIAAGTLRQLNTDAGSGELAFLPGYRQVVYFTNRGALMMQDIESLQRWVIADSLPYAADLPKSIVASPDGRTLYYGAQQVESNIWIVRRAAAKNP